MQMAVETNMSSKDLEDDEELAALRLAALNSLKSKQKNQPRETNQTETEVKYSTPIVTVGKSIPNTHTSPNNVPYNHAQSSLQSNPYSWRKPRWHTGQSNKSSQRSNLIVINPIPMQDQTTSSNKVETTSFNKVQKPTLVLPQHKWFHDSATNDGSSSPKTFRKTGPTRFNRHGSDSDSSDVEIDDVDDDSSSRMTDIREECVKLDSTPICSPVDRVLVDSDTSLTGINDNEHLSDDKSGESESVYKPRTPSPLIESTLINKGIANGFFSDTLSESESDLESKHSRVSPSRSYKERSKTPPVNFFEDDPKKDASDCVSIAKQKEDHFKQVPLEFEINLLNCKSEENPSQSISKAEMNLCVPVFKSETSVSSEKLDSSTRDCVPNLSTHVSKLPSPTVNNEIKCQPLPSTDLRFALKKRREERQLASDDVMKGEKESFPLERNSKNSGDSRSSCSRDSSADSCSSSDFAFKSVSSIVKAVQSDKVKDVKESLQQSRFGQGQDNHARHHGPKKRFRRRTSSSTESADSDKETRSWSPKMEKKLKYSSSIKVQVSDVNRSCDVAPDSKARVPVHLRLGNLPQKRVIQMTESSRFSDSDSGNSVNNKCKKQNMKIIAEVYKDETVDNCESKKKKKRSRNRSSKEKLWKKTAR